MKRVKCFCIVGRHTCSPTQGDFDPETNSGVCDACSDLTPLTSAMSRDTRVPKRGRKTPDGMLYHAFTVLGITPTLEQELRAQRFITSVTNRRLYKATPISKSSIKALLNDLGITLGKGEIYQLRVELVTLFRRMDYRSPRQNGGTSYRRRAELHSQTDEQLWDPRIINDRMRYQDRLLLEGRNHLPNDDPTKRVEASKTLLAKYARGATHTVSDAQRSDPKATPQPASLRSCFEDQFPSGRLQARTSAYAASSHRSMLISGS